MRYTKAALLIFGLGLVLGLVVVAAEVPGLARVASAVMAAGLVLLPLALLADGRGTALVRRIIARLRRKPAKRGKPRVPAVRRLPRAAAVARAPRRRRR